MGKITGIILTKNEETMIADCIESLSFCEEVLVIDSNSTDRTVEIAQFMKAKVLYPDTNDFAEKRNYAIKKAKGNWLLYVDADERITDELKTEILRVTEMRGAHSAYRLKRKNFYLGETEWPQIERLERLFKKKNLHSWHGSLHETAQVDGTIGELEGYLLHYTHRDLRSMLTKTIAWSGVEAELRFRANHPKMTWWRFPRVMLMAFIDSYIKQKGYTVGTVGLIESTYQAFSMFVTYARLWELQKKKEKTTSILEVS